MSEGKKKGGGSNGSKVYLRKHKNRVDPTTGSDTGSGNKEHNINQNKISKQKQFYKGDVKTITNKQRLKH